MDLQTALNLAGKVPKRDLATVLVLEKILRPIRRFERRRILSLVNEMFA